MQSLVPKFVPTFDSPNTHSIHNPAIPRRTPFQPLSPTLSPSHSPSPTDTVDDDNLPSPLSPSPANHYQYAIHSPAHNLYDSAHNSSSYSFTSTNTNGSANNNYSVVPHHPSSRDSADPLHQPNYLSESPSPIDIHPSSHLTPPLSAPHSQHHFPASSYHTHPSNYRYLRTNGTSSISKYAHAHLDHRRMSEPALFQTSYATPTTDAAAGRYQQFHFAHQSPHRVTSLHRGISTGSLRDLHQQQQQHPFDYSPSHSSWKSEDHQHHTSYHPHHHRHHHAQHHHSLDSFHSDDQLSPPLNNNFSVTAAGSPPLGMPGLQYSCIAEDPYGPSPPGTGTSTSSNGPLTVALPRSGLPLPSDPFSINVSSRCDSRPSIKTNNVTNASFRSPDQAARQDRNNPPNANGKTYSFVSLPGNAVKKRPRRRYDEIERLYQCAWPDCNKAYGTLNHLNAHVTMQKHGQKRSPNEFKELRKQWRKAKKESDEQARSKSRGVAVPPHDSRASAPQPSYMTPSHSPDYPHHTLGLPSNVSVPALIPDSRYSGIDVPIDDIRFTIDERERLAHDNRERERDVVRQRYSTGTPTAWPHPERSLSNSSSGTGSGYETQPPAPVVQSQQAVLPHDHLTTAQQQSAAHISRLADVVLNRLPADSTLLTPLPGYEPPTLLPPLGDMQVDTHPHSHGHGHGDLIYPNGFDGSYEGERKPSISELGSGPGPLSGSGQGQPGGEGYEL